MTASGARVRVVLSTVAGEAAARSLARLWVESGRAACVSIVPGVRSVYRWQGKVQEDDELLLVVKTAFADAEAGQLLLASLAEDHPYEEPEFLVLDPSQGAPGYLAWVLQAVQ